MKKLVVLLAGLVAIAALLVPVMASVDQNADAYIHGNGNDQSIDNSNYQSEQTIDANQRGNGNSQVITNTHINTNGGNIVNGATSVNNDQDVSVVLNSAPTHHTLDTGVINSQVVSIYSGEVLVINNDGGDNIIQTEGDVYRYTVKSSVPVLAYVINSNCDSAVKMLSGAPEYDTVYQKYTHGNMDIAYSPKHMSTNQMFTVVLPDSGRYSLVIDSRVSNNLNGMQAQITPSTIDVYLNIEKSTDGVKQTQIREIIGTVDTYPILSNGMADTSGVVAGISN